MLRNQLRSQLSSSLNPDSMYQVLSRNQSVRQQKGNSSQQTAKRQTILKTERNSTGKMKYLTVVSKPTRLGKSLKTNKKLLSKKSNSVILGGTKKGLLNATQQSLQSSRCNSCIDLHQSYNNATSPSSIPSQTIVQSTQALNLQGNLPINFITLQNNNAQLNKIINHKLNLASVQPHQLFTSTVRFNTQGKNENGNFERKLLRNVSSSAGRIYFSVGNEERKSTVPQSVERPFLTPRFDKTEDNQQRKKRKNVGFIRSASARKQSPQQNELKKQQKVPISTFTPSAVNQPPSSAHKKSQQIDQCIQKMSMIRKQIDQLQQMIHDRMQTSQLRSKLMYTRQSRVSNREEFVGSRFQEASFMQEKGQGLQNQYQQRQDSQLGKRNSTLVDDLDAFSRTLSRSKLALGESSVVAQRENVTIVRTQSNSQQKPIYTINQTLSHPPTSISHIIDQAYKLKCPTPMQPQLMQKQLINQFTLRNTQQQPTHLVRDQRFNQENIVYSRHQQKARDVMNVMR